MGQVIVDQYRFNTVPKPVEPVKPDTKNFELEALRAMADLPPGEALVIPYTTRRYPAVHHQLTLAFEASDYRRHFRLRTKAEQDCFYAWFEPRNP